MIGAIRKWMTGKGERREVAEKAPAAPAPAWSKLAFDASEFDRIEASGRVSVEWSRGEPWISAMVDEADAAAAPIEVRIEGRRLIVDMPAGSVHPARVEARSERLDAFRCAGQACGSAQGLDAEVFEASLADGPRLTLSGKAIAGRLFVMGSGHLDADQLSCHTVMAKVAGSGLLDARAESVAEAAVDGGGEVVVRGDPAVSKIERLGDGRAKVGSRVGVVEPENAGGIFDQMPLPRE